MKGEIQTWKFYNNKQKILRICLQLVINESGSGPDSMFPVQDCEVKQCFWKNRL